MMGRVILLLMLLALNAVISGAYAQSDSVLTVSAQTERVKLNEQLTFRVTHDNFSIKRLGLDNRERWQDFNALRSHQSGADKPVVWGALRVYNRSRSVQRYIIDFGDAYIENASAYVLDGRGRILDSASVSFDEPLLNRAYIHDQIMLPLDLPASQTAWIVIAAKQWPQQLNTISLWAPQALQLHTQQKQTALGVNAGVLLLLAVAAFSLARGSRRLLQISLGAATTGFIFVMLLHSGIWITYFSPYTPEVAAYLVPYAKQWLLLSLVWLVREGIKRDLKTTRWLSLINFLLGFELLVLVAQPWWSALHSDAWLSVQASVWLVIATFICARTVKLTTDRITRWFVLLLIPLSFIAWLLVLPRVNTIWQGLSGIVLYSILTANVLALILAQLDKTLARLERRINSLKAMKNFYRDGYWRFLTRSNEGWFELNEKQQWRRVSRQFLKIMGINHADVLRRHWSTVDTLFGEQAKTWNDKNRTESWEHLTSVERLDGKTIWLQIEIFNDGRGRILEVTQQVEAEMHLNFLVKHDALTGLLNEREFHRLLQRQIERQKPLALITLKIGGLQVVKDQSDPATRDQALLQLVLSLREKLPSGTRVARVDEYKLGIFLNDTEQAGFTLGYQLVQVCREFRFTTSHRVFQLSAHAGVAVATPSTINVSSLLHRVEDALKLAEQSGEFSVHSATDDDQRRLQGQVERNWEQRLRQALVNEEWLLFQQPMVSGNRAHDKHCFEILLRLPESNNTDPDEALAPQQFLTAALKAGIMGKADRWLLRHVVDTFSENPFAATRLWRCHINLSIQSLEDDELINFIAQEIEQSNLRPEQLAFEIAEPVVSDNFERAYRLFKQLRELGCITVIDQFGTGFNSFRLLRQMPLTQIKINRFWVQNMLLDAVEAELVMSCIRLARAAGVEVSAVGVENDDTRTALLNEKVDYIQGYVCGRPVRWNFSGA